MAFRKLWPYSFLGNQAESNDYSFKIRIYHPEDSLCELISGGRTISVERDTNASSFDFSDDTAKKFITRDEDGDLIIHYSITIGKQVVS